MGSVTLTFSTRISFNEGRDQAALVTRSHSIIAIDRNCRRVFLDIKCL